MAEFVKTYFDALQEVENVTGCLEEWPPCVLSYLLYEKPTERVIEYVSRFMYRKNVPVDTAANFLVKHIEQYNNVRDKLWYRLNEKRCEEGELSGALSTLRVKGDGAQYEGRQQ